MAKRPLTQQELTSHLSDQLAFLEASSSSFDTGFDAEAKRLALTMRVLLHDTNNSHSLLQQLGKKNIKFVDTALPFDPKNLSTHGGLVFVAMNGPDTRYVAMLDDVPQLSHIDFDKWWDAPAFVDKDRNILTRRQLVLTAANQDGGGHVDPGIDEIYDKLVNNNSMNLSLTVAGVHRPLDGPERAAIRQIAHEVIKTLKPTYSKKPQHQAQMFVGGMSLVPGGPQAAQQVAEMYPKVGRNKPCPCRSGKKYKHCHGKLV